MKMYTTIEMIFAITLLLATTAYGQVPAQDSNGFYNYVDTTHQLLQLNKGDKEFAMLQLDHPIKFYSEEYDTIFINTHGILTFNLEFTEFINQPFPLEYPSIAPFYSNVDTSGNNDTTQITLFESRHSEQLLQASSFVRYAFDDHKDFEADKIIVATWQNVGYFQGKSDKVNSFQAVVIVNEEQTFVQFIYPENGLNWLQAEGGRLGLPDIRPQVGFAAEDGRVFHLEGSATENARYLAKTSNVGSPGNWLYHVGPLSYTDNVQPPNNPSIPQETPKMFWTCREASHGFCNSHAQCFDKSAGFCCVCEDNYYGNGHYCIKKDEPLRVTGSLSGEINGEIIDDRVRLQSYVELNDAHTYTAINPLNMGLGTNLRLALPLVSTIGWLFAKPLNNALNGFQLTGGEFTQESTIHFESGEVLNINQTFEGLNYWDQLAVKIVVFGKVPRITYGSRLHMADYVDEYKFEAPGTLRSVHPHSLEVVDEKRVINFQLDQTIYFERCLLEDQSDLSGTSVLQKASKIVLDYFERDQAVRSSVMSKIGVDTETNSCNDGTATCGANTVCVPYEDTYRCDCLHGYSPEVNEYNEEICGDIDECNLETPVCDENAQCTNTGGGFICTCLDGFFGNGFRCEVNSTIEDNETPQNIVIPDIDIRNSVPESNNNQQDSICYHCSHDADCISGQCICRPGFSGDGFDCETICPYGHIWLDGKCQPFTLNYMEVAPHCDNTGVCICTEGFTLSENHMCTYVEQISSDNRVPNTGSCDIEHNCHPNATCTWYEHEHAYMCDCNSGFYGDGYRCDPVEDACFKNSEICDPNAFCQVDEVLQRAECVCKSGYEGDGLHCDLIPECSNDIDCGSNAQCDRNTCVCMPGYERYASDLCVLIGRCGSTNCGVNALCKWDAGQQVQYCDCMEGYEGNPLEGCRSAPLPCNIKNNCGVHANCEPTEDPARYECRCDVGFKGDGYVCMEVENCLNNPHLCDLNAQCQSTNNGLVCVCNQGFYGNGSVCFERQVQESGFLLVSQGVLIVRVPLNGKDIKPITVGNFIIDLDKDCVSGRVYWSDIGTKQIESCKYDGSDRRVFVKDDVESPEGIAIDSSSRRIYWTDSVKDTIEVASLDDPTLRTVVINKNLVNPRGIAVDTLREKLYWSDWDRDSPKIEMSNLDGTQRELLLGVDSVNLPNSLVVLESSGELCFADAGKKIIQCIEPYSKNLRIITNTTSYPFGLTFAQNDFYFTDWTTKKLEKVDNYNGQRESVQILLFKSQKMFGLTAVEDKCPQMNTPCSMNNGGCSDNRICLTNRQAPSGKSCKCTPNSLNCNIPRSGVIF